MKSVSVSVLKARLSEYLRIVRNGEEVIVTERGSPIARLAPLASMERLDARIQDLVRAGLARPPEAEIPSDFWNRSRIRDPEGLSLKAVLEERESGS